MPLDSDIIQQKGELLLQKEILTEKGVRHLLSYAANNPNRLDNENFLILEFLRMAFSDALVSRSKSSNKIEKKIKPEDEPVAFYWALPLRPVKIEKNLIHPKRSAFGLTRTRTLHELKNIGLIGDQTFNEAQIKLKESSIVEEGGLVAYLFEKENCHAKLSKIYLIQL